MFAKTPVTGSAEHFLWHCFNSPLPRSSSDYSKSLVLRPVQKDLQTCPGRHRNLPSCWNRWDVLIRWCKVIQVKHRHHFGELAVVIQKQKKLKRIKNSEEAENIQLCSEANLHCINYVADTFVLYQSVLATNSSTYEANPASWKRTVQI